MCTGTVKSFVLVLGETLFVQKTLFVQREEHHSPTQELVHRALQWLTIVYAVSR